MVARKRSGGGTVAFRQVGSLGYDIAALAPEHVQLSSTPHVPTPFHASHYARLYAFGLWQYQITFVWSHHRFLAQIYRGLARSRRRSGYSKCSIQRYTIEMLQMCISGAVSVGWLLCGLSEKIASTFLNFLQLSCHTSHLQA